MFDAVKKRKCLLSWQEPTPSAAVDFEGLPAVSQLLAGVRSSDGKAWDSPPHTLMMWAEGDWIKFCFTAGEDNPKCWGSFQGLAMGLDGVEKALQEDRCDWREPKASKGGLHRVSQNGKS
jgi:hypothetical protein